jgi:hypothetical protein
LCRLPRIYGTHRSGSRAADSGCAGKISRGITAALIGATTLMWMLAFFHVSDPLSIMCRQYRIENKSLFRCERMPQKGAFAHFLTIQNAT